MASGICLDEGHVYQNQAGLASVIRVAIAGAAGRMGRALVVACENHEAVTLQHAFEQPGHDAVGQSAGMLAGTTNRGPVIGDSIAGPPFDVLVDFTTPETTLANLSYCAQHQARAVIGTTGFDAPQKELMAKVSLETAVVLAPNMSIGVNVCLKLLEVAAQAFGDDVDIEVIEAHHRNKVDAPSGTALKMGEVVANTLGRSLDQEGVFSRHGHTGARQDRQIGFATVRAADIVGEHSVWFAGAGERVEITHKASSREIYANGALRCALWLAEQSTGLFDMQDVLGLRRHGID
ncbi:MAG: 4-hydroxy-tetrahydrodipicolinate reductase [Acidiferrobacteraceae bacterium]|jgi:4-hydroxy-tetrahydrodipicolinate reductase|nr:4-hydroxy-tetrahydrodipicolinate reductase [Acidiferrobacteraceae bacterium]MCP4827947.1 4-hydroxy-tetrahydrodipicolinate reductase [Pseudomonadota bacterium]HJP06345.1 4-hydroxy-tetrahydrodipicolinate reductase [Arenicellales bacterium]|tara:strand:+ start:1110 stop:1985 length:876 start_codon:yes stop_codon:yes gene_type:complete